jgi:hypothetical protein
MSNEFVILKNNKLETFTRYEDIPEKFDNLIKFLPEIPEPPHTHEQHQELDLWNERLKGLMKRETNGN